MPVEWPKLDPDWLFAQLLMKPIRVSTCLCHFHLICVCKRRQPIAAQLHGCSNATGPPAVREKPIREPEGAGPAHSDTLLCEKQHGQERRLGGLYTHTLHVPHISCSIADRSAGLTTQHRETPKPSWIRYAASPTTLVDARDPISQVFEGN